MAATSKKLSGLSQKIRQLYQEERAQKDKFKRFGKWAQRWALMIYHEFLRDDVKVRAESLTFLMIFSLLPLVAGAFFVFTIFAQFGFVQEALYGFVDQFLSTIPGEHRTFVRDYVIEFKDSYLKSMSEKSGSVGIFALFILVWVGVQTFTNIDRMLNHIWGSERQRSFFEQVRNFLVVAVAFPMALISGLSLPPILQKLPATKYVFDTVPILWVLLNAILTPALIWGTFVMLYRYVPTRTVKWKAAILGALFSTLCFTLANHLLRLYFVFGTHSAYGKAAVVPLIGFWMYIVWIIIILGAEVSFLHQNQRDLLYESYLEPTVKEGGSLLAVLGLLIDAHRTGKNPVDFEKLRLAAGLPSTRLHCIIDFLLRKKLIVECVSTKASTEGAYALGKESGTIELDELLRDFYRSAQDIPSFDLEKAWQSGLDTWFKSFSDLSLSSNGKKKKS